MPESLTTTIAPQRRDTFSTPPHRTFSRAIVLGGGRIACDCLTLLNNAGIPVQAIQNDPSPFSLLQHTASRPGCSWQKLTEQQELTSFFLSVQQPTLVVSANNAWIIPQQVLDNPSLRFINYHNSLLPRHRGRNAPTWAIFSGDQYAGATWHHIDAGIDTGPIIAQKAVPITPLTTALQLVAQCMQAAAELFRQLLPHILSWSLPTVRPKHHLTEYHSSQTVPAQGLLDPTWSFPRISRFLRAVDYGPLDILPKPRLLREQSEPDSCPIITRYFLHNSQTPPPVPQAPDCRSLVIHRPDTSITLWLQ
jgi:methionyl-tRNA formyltransferase